MDLTLLAVMAGGLLVFSTVSRKVQGTVLTAPLVFVGFGLLVGNAGLSLVTFTAGHEAVHLLAELTLIFVLFSDAARIDLQRLRRDHNLPVRMLAFGLPLSIVAGALVAALLFPSFTFWELALLGALLAPTDAALGQSVVSDRIVPVRIRQTINVESGLNDGIALPAVLLFAALASHESSAPEAAGWIRFGVLQITLGPIVGVAFGYLGGRVIDGAAARELASSSFQGIAIISLAIVTYVVAEAVGGNGFIAAFLGGLLFGNTIRHPCTFLFEFMETEGQLLMLFTFFVFGATLLPEIVDYLNLSILIYAVLSLSVIRMISIAISLLGAGVKVPTMLFLGWFGPRGLASILFVLLIVEGSELAHREEILAIALLTVALSVLLHGITAAPLAKLYGHRAERMGECEENQPVSELPLRHGPPNS